MAIHVTDATHRPDFTVVSLITIKGADPKTDSLSYTTSTVILPNRVRIRYVYQDGEWEAKEVRVSGRRILNSGLLGKTDHGVEYFSWSQRSMPTWVSDIVTKYKPTIQITPST